MPSNKFTLFAVFNGSRAIFLAICVALSMRFTVVALLLLLAVRGDDGEEALPALVDLSLSSAKPPPKPVVVRSGASHDYDAPD